MAEKAKHAFGALEKIDSALASGTIDAYDILFVKDASGKPYVGWIDKDGQKVICDDTAEFAELESQIAAKVSADEVDAKIANKANVEDITQLDTKLATKADADEVERSYEKIKYEISDVPDGTLVSYRDNEIRIMASANCQWVKQSVGSGGKSNCYYVTFKTYVPNDNVAGYIEHLGDQTDSEILTQFATDKYGRRYQPTWLAIAEYDETTDAWTYYGAESNEDKFIGYDYRIDWFDANNKMIASDCVRINLSNEDCHSAIKPYYGVSTTEEIETKVEEVVEEKVEEAVETKVEEVVETKMTEKVEAAVTTSNAYTDAQIEAKMAELAAVYEVIEF